MRFILGYIKKYKITYISIIIIFLIGVGIGSMFLLKAPIEEKNELKTYIMDSVIDTKTAGIDRTIVFKKSIIENLKFIGILYFLGCTIIASFTIYIAIVYKGFILGYTGIAVLISYGVGSGFKYLIPTLILHNILYLPIVFLLATSGIRMYKEIMKKTINLKLELLKHSIIMLICIVFCIVSSGVEAYFSTIIFEIL